MSSLSQRGLPGALWAKNAAQSPASTPLLGIDANVLFCLTLPLKTTVNHKAKATIRLAYDQNTLKTLQNDQLAYCD